VIAVFENDEQRAGVFHYLKDNNFLTTNPSLYHALKGLQTNDIYLACFSGEEAEDSLPMWYMYADHGSGVCLGFDGKAMLAAHQSKFIDFPEQAYAMVVYDIKQFKYGIATFLQSIANFLTRFFADGCDDQKLNGGEFLYFVSYYVAVAALSFKHPKFAHEKECRVFCRNPREEGLPHVGFYSTSSGMVRAYIPIQYPGLATNLLRRVWLGPANLNQLDILKIFFAKSVGTLVEAKKSEIPFRNV
jgi:Protein of unknown function (DUF2971)